MQLIPIISLDKPCCLLSWSMRMAEWLVSSTHSAVLYYFSAPDFGSGGPGFQSSRKPNPA